MSETWVIDTPAPEIDQVTGSFAVTAPKLVVPSLTELAIPLVTTGGAAKLAKDMKQPTNKKVSLAISRLELTRHTSL